MKHTGLDEQEAFRRLTKLATDTNRKLVAVASVILEAGEVFRQLEQGDARKATHREPPGSGGGKSAPVQTERFVPEGQARLPAPGVNQDVGGS